VNFALRHAGLAAAAVAISAMVAATSSATAAPGKASGTKITLRKSPQGKVLVGAGRKFVYVHVNGKQDVGCAGICRTIWPVATTSGKPRAGHGVKQSKLGRKGGQVTYHGHRLWYYSPNPQHPSGDGANSFGGDWLLITPKGKFR
jgi:predicted lipoprotein with Yx(FWY)xxD motif